MELIDPLDFDRRRLAEVLQRRLNENTKYKMSITSQVKANYYMNKDLTYILDGKMPRSYGETPANLGNYEMIAPSDLSLRLSKLISGKDILKQIQQSHSLHLLK